MEQINDDTIITEFLDDLRMQDKTKRTVDDYHSCIRVYRKWLTDNELNILSVDTLEDKGIIDPDMRSEGGFRLFSEIYIYLCKLIKDLQLFGYSLEEIKKISDLFRDFLAIEKNPVIFKKDETAAKLSQMLSEIQILFDKMALFKQGIQRWEDLLKKKKKEILSLRNQIGKKPGKEKEKK